MLLDATNPAPWTATEKAAALARTVKPRYRVITDPEGTAIEVPATGVVVTYDSGASPMATLDAVLPRTADVWGNRINVYNSSEIIVQAGYEIAGAVTTWGTIFAGVVTRSRSALGGITIRAESAESFWSHPYYGSSSATDYNVPNEFTGLDDVADDLLGSGLLYRDVSVVSEHLNSPSGTQLSQFRAQIINPGSDFDEWFRMLADCLGQWCRGDYRGRYTDLTPTFTPAGPLQYLVTGRPDSWTPLDITDLIDAPSREDVQSLDDYFNVLNLTAEWIVAGTTTSKKAVFAGTTAAEETGPPVRSKDVTVHMRPQTGAIAANNPTAAAWLAHQGEYETGTFTLPALWWLDVGMQVQYRDWWYEDPGYVTPKLTGTIKRLRFLPDQGLMSIDVVRSAT